MKVSNLVRYVSVENRHELYFAKLRLSQFCNCYDVTESIEVLEFSGSDLSRAFDLGDGVNITSLQQLVKYTERHVNLTLDLLKFKMPNRDIEVIFNDDTDCTIYGSKCDFWNEHGIKILKCVGLSTLSDKLLSNQGKYLVVHASGDVIAYFSDFRSYVRSEFSTDPDSFEELRD